MPVTLADDLVALLIRALMGRPPTAGQVIINMLDQQESLLQQLIAKVEEMSQTQSQSDQDFRAELQAFTADVEKQTTVANGLKVAFAGLAQQVSDLLAQRQAAGATPDELKGLQELHQAVSANTDLMSAVTANTQAQNEPPAPVQPTTTVDVPSDNSTGGATPSTQPTA